MDVSFLGFRSSLTNFRQQTLAIVNDNLFEINLENFNKNTSVYITNQINFYMKKTVKNCQTYLYVYLNKNELLSPRP